MQLNRVFWASIIFACATASAKPYKGGELYTKQTFKYGKFEARILMPAGSGVVSSMFLYYNDSYKGSPEPWREIDIEVLGKNPTQFQSNIITGNAANRITSEDYHAVPEGAHQIYHTYAIEWTPNFVRWTVDGIEVRKTPGQQVVDLQDKEQNLRFNLWAANITSWVGSWNDAILPVYQYINWIKVWNWTPGTGPNGSDYTLAWTEDFNDSDMSRWGVADWTFTENLADFVPENIVVKNGTLILCLTKENALGHSGPVPADNGQPVPLRPLRSREPRNLQPNIRGESSMRLFDLRGASINAWNISPLFSQYVKFFKPQS